MSSPHPHQSLLTFMLALALALPLLLLGCAQPSAQLPPPQPADEQIEGRLAVDRTLVRKLDAMFADLADHVRATTGDAAPQMVARYPLRLQQFQNATTAEPDAFFAHRTELLRLMEQLALRHGLNLTDNPTRGGTATFDLRIAAVDLSADQWLLQMATTGRGRDGTPRTIWSDQLAVPAP